jgi:hypothetical protein
MRRHPVEPTLTDFDVQPGDDFDLDVRFEPVVEGDDSERPAALKPSIASECCTNASMCCN